MEETAEAASAITGVEAAAVPALASLQAGKPALNTAVTSATTKGDKKTPIAAEANA
jgi:hypothetical protein